MRAAPGKKKWAALHKEELNAYSRKRNRERREFALIAYGDHRCACCGESRYEFLAFDHINDDGAQHRKLVPGGEKFVRWLLKEPQDGIQVLCHNCNAAKGYYGCCPHQVERGEIESIEAH